MASAAVQVQNFVGKEVNGFEIIKLIGISIVLNKYFLKVKESSPMFLRRKGRPMVYVSHSNLSR
jgi:hypothetical protein